MDEINFIDRKYVIGSSERPTGSSVIGTIGHSFKDIQWIYNLLQDDSLSVMIFTEEYLKRNRENPYSVFWKGDLKTKRKELFLLSLHNYGYYYVDLNNKQTEPACYGRHIPNSIPIKDFLNDKQKWDI